MTKMMQPDFDVLVAGAGISGISAGYHIQKHLPKARFAIFEGRHTIGGTWDLFKYPGIRSDSDMYTLGFSFRPWTNPKAIADGPSIMNYLHEAKRDYGLDDKIRLNHRIISADWDSARGLWTVRVRIGAADAEGETKTYTARFLYMCTGYYNYDAGYRPEWAGEKAFKGQVVHPQFWPENLDYSGKRVAVIGSGATAVTLVPELAKQAAHVTMVQRSPTYIVSMPSESAFANFLHKYLPARLAHGVTRWKNVALGRFMFWYCRKFPARAKAALLKGVAAELPQGIDIKKHFTPRYNPWDQRICLAPDGDFFASLRAGTSSVVTDTIKSFTAKGLALNSGETVEADIIVTATGLQMGFFGGMTLSIDGVPVNSGEHLSYKGMMFSDVPNLALATGYTNASWTLKCDLTAMYVCRLIRHMERKGYTQCCPGVHGTAPEIAPLMDFSSGYITRATAALPKQGTTRPWRMYQNYFMDLFMLSFGSVRDRAMVFSAIKLPEDAAQGGEATQAAE